MMASIYDYSECDEVADSILTTIDELFPTFDEALAYVRKQIPDQGETVICNVAEALVAEPEPKAPIDGWGVW
jgi:hypothetical protein